MISPQHQAGRSLIDPPRTRAERKPTGKSNQGQHRNRDVYLGRDSEREHRRDLRMTIVRGVRVQGGREKRGGGNEDADSLQEDGNADAPSLQRDINEDAPSL